MNKSVFMRFGLSVFLLGLVFCYQNCGGPFEMTSPKSTAENDSEQVPASDSWVVNPQPTFIEGSTDTYDLSATLPTGIVKGGIFSIDASGTNLPIGMTLSPDGILAVGAANLGSTTGVVFNYTEP